jgi:hypothetical protein
MSDELAAAVAASDASRAAGVLQRALARGERAWDLHLSLHAVVQRVMNPPFINPHLPKMYRIVRELAPYLDDGGLHALLRLEVNEYARRPKLPEMPRAAGAVAASPPSLDEIQRALGDKDAEKAAVLMGALVAHRGKAELARQLLLMGSGYLEASLGHSVSCTAFILLEMMERADEDPWLTLAVLADYFCKGGFRERPVLRGLGGPSSHALGADRLRRAASGRGIVNLHHPITLYAVERVRHLLTPQEGDHLIASWAAFMGDKDAESAGLEGGKAPRDYERFFEMFCELDARSVASSLWALAGEEGGRLRAGRYLIQALCERYRGDYNPHVLTGLGSTLWLLERYPRERELCAAALLQYLDYVMGSLKA